MTTKPVFGLADTHAHFMAELECGGSFFWGNTYSQVEGSDEDRLRAALGPREGGLTIGAFQEGSTGYPTFDKWPRFGTLFYQQAYIDWIYRAYHDGGLRLVSCLCVNNESVTQRLYGEKSAIPTPVELFAHLFMSADLPYDTQSVINLQIVAIKGMVKYVAENQGGWMQIAYSPQEAREIINQDKLAVILGVEVDSLGNWRKPEDLEAEARQRGTDVRTVIRCELERLYYQGVRQITPIHLCDNPFGGASIYKALFNTVNVDIAGYNFDIEDGFNAGIRYRMDKDKGEPSPRVLMELFGLLELDSSLPFSPFHRKLAGLKSHRNRRGLTPYGEILIEEMMRLGMVIDIDHMSDRSKDKTLELALNHQYPIICSHAFGFRDLALTADVPFDHDAPRDEYRTSEVYNVANENHIRSSDLETIHQLGGHVSVLLNQGELRDFDGPSGIKSTAKATVENNCSGTSRSWAQAYLYALEIMGGQGVGLGSDVNGLAGLPGPRFGTFAAYKLEGDEFRDSDGMLRAHQAEAQTNGVSYDEPLIYPASERFHGTAYDGEGDGNLTRDIWRAIALFKAGVEPYEQDRGDNIAIGLKAGVSGDESVLDCGFLREECSHQRRAGYMVTSGLEPTDRDSREVHELYAKIQQYFRRWQAMEGTNTPLKRSVVGARDFDYNLDGFAHYGMMPDFLQDLRNIGLQDKHLDSLYHSAESYVSTWEKCLARSEALFGSITVPSAECPPLE